MKTTKVLCVPDWRAGNPYLSLLEQAVEPHNIQIRYANLSRGPLPLLRLRLSEIQINIIHIHWSNELLSPALWSKSPAKRLMRRALLAIDLIAVRLTGVRVVWTVHNLVAHESSNISAEFEARATLARYSSRIIVHSESALQTIQSSYGLHSFDREKFAVIRHGNYDGQYEANAVLGAELEAKWKIAPSEIRVLFFGGIRPYKGVEKLLSAFGKSKRSDVRLIIAGKPFDEHFREFLVGAALSDSRILLALEFIPDHQVAAYFSIADVVIIPFERTLTSGSAVLAMTMGKAIYLPQEAKVLDLADERGASFFDTESELTGLLDRMSKDQLRQMGSANLRTSHEFTWERSGRLTACVYRNELIS